MVIKLPVRIPSGNFCHSISSFWKDQLVKQGKFTSKTSLWDRHVFSIPPYCIIITNAEITIQVKYERSIFKTLPKKILQIIGNVRIYSGKEFKDTNKYTSLPHYDELLVIFSDVLVDIPQQGNCYQNDSYNIQDSIWRKISPQKPKLCINLKFQYNNKYLNRLLGFTFNNNKPSG